MRIPSRLVELDDIISSQILGEDSEILALVLRIHLALEALMIELIQAVRPGDIALRGSFPRKCGALKSVGLITEMDVQALLRFNDVRNDFAHIFGHEITLAEALKLAVDIEAYGVDFSDSAGHYSEAEAQTYYGGTLGVLAEVGWCLLHHIAFIQMEAGGRSIF